MGQHKCNIFGWLFVATIGGFAFADDTSTGLVSGTFVEILNGAICRYQPRDAPPDVSKDAAKNVLVNSKTYVTLDGKPSNLGALKAGMWLRFPAEENDGVLQHLEAFTQPMDGKVHDLAGNFDSAKGNSLTLTKNNNKTTVKIDASTKFLLDEKPAGVGQLHHGMILSKVQVKDGVALLVQAVVVERDGAMHKCEGDLVRVSEEELVIHVWGADGFDVALKPRANFKSKAIRNEAQAALTDFKAGEHVVANYKDGVAMDLTLLAPAAAAGRGGNARPAGAAAVPAKDPSLELP